MLSQLNKNTNCWCLVSRLHINLLILVLYPLTLWTTWTTVQIVIIWNNWDNLNDEFVVLLNQSVPLNKVCIGTLDKGTGWFCLETERDQTSTNNLTSGGQNWPTLSVVCGFWLIVQKHENGWYRNALREWTLFCAAKLIYPIVSHPYSKEIFEIKIVFPIYFCLLKSFNKTPSHIKIADFPGVQVLSTDKLTNE